MRGDLDVYPHVQVPMSVALDILDAFAFEAKHRSGLSAGRNFDGRMPLERGHIDVRAQRGMNKTDRNFAKQVVAIALKYFVRFDMHHDVKVARGRSPQTCFAIAR